MAEEFSKIINNFSSNIFNNCIADKNNKNVILSPLSIQTALSLLFMGANGQTADEMSSVMKYEKITRDEIAKHFQTLTSNENPLVKIANKIYVLDGYKIKDEFNEIAKSKFASEAQNINFAESVKSANEINKWVEKKTDGKIRDLVQSSELDGSTRIILVNAIHFKGLWVHRFFPSGTEPKKFWTSETESVDVPTMHAKKFFTYGVFDDLDAVGIEMCYQESNMSMVIILPNKREGLQKLKSDLTQIEYSTLYEKMSRQEVNVALPKFKFEFEIKLNDILAKMGMKSMFSNNANLSDLLDSPENLKVTEVLHKAFIDVNEDGTEATASTKIRVAKTCCLGAKKEPIYFIADHPFLFIIKDTDNVTYFSGHVYNIKP